MGSSPHLLIQFSWSVMSNSLQPHGLQHSRLPCPSPTPRAYSNSCPSRQWCHPTISSSVVPISCHLKSFTHQGLSNELVLRIRWPKYWNFSFSISPSNEHLDWFPLAWSPCSPRGSQESSPTPQFKSINSSELSFVDTPTLTSIHDYWKNHSLD